MWKEISNEMAMSIMKCESNVSSSMSNQFN